MVKEDGGTNMETGRTEKTFFLLNCFDFIGINILNTLQLPRMRSRPVTAAVPCRDVILDPGETLLATGLSPVVNEGVGG